ncbi:MAG: hypothetical protein RQ753_02345, partial [Desulfurivibrionaceae bacterium]|nr:hypothetical protein [Desulfurivibrionaceae bacterium]
MINLSTIADRENPALMSGFRAAIMPGALTIQYAARMQIAVFLSHRISLVKENTERPFSLPDPDEFGKTTHCGSRLVHGFWPRPASKRLWMLSKPPFDRTAT